MRRLAVLDRPYHLRLLSEEFVKNRTIEWLGREGYRVISVKGLAEHGLDIRTKRTTSNYYYSIEVKGRPTA